MFSQAINELNASGRSLSIPESFRGYCSRAGISPTADTASLISVQCLSKLHHELRAAGCMAFRLGIPPGETTTYFGLSKISSSWSDYFLIDDHIFQNIDTQSYIPTSSHRDLYAFSLIPKFTETTAINFALASGLLKEALELDDNPSIPVTGRSTYTFKFSPRLPEDAMWTHHKGQVEIDGAFTARRNGRDCLFIIEAKHGSFDSLAKTKLLFPFLAIQPQAPSSMPVVLVYLRSTYTTEGISYSIVECTAPSSSAPSPLDMHPISPKILAVTHIGR